MRKKIAIIGTGKIGRALARGLRSALAPQDLELICADSKPTSFEELKSIPGIEFTTSNREALQNKKIVLLSVKPFQARDVLAELKEKLSEDHLLISICASITLAQLREWAGPDCSIIRAMPNLPVTVGQGITVLSAESGTEKDHLRLAEEIFSTVGHVLSLDEIHLDSVTALSGSGPAFMFFFIEALSEAGAQLGIPKAKAFELVFHTMRGSAELCLQTNLDPQSLIQQVATPGGCTVEGLKVFSETNVRESLIKCIQATAKRASELRQLS